MLQDKFNRNQISFHFWNNLVISENWRERTGWFMDKHNESVNQLWGLWQRYTSIISFSASSIIQDSEQNTRPRSPDPIQSLIIKGREVQISRVHFNCYSITVSQLILKSHLDQIPTFSFSNLPNQIHGLTPSHQMTAANAVFQTLCFVHNTKQCTKSRSSVLLTVCFRPSRSL